VWVAVDPGSVRTGVAACDRGQVLASPVATLPKAEAVTGVVAIVQEREAVGVVVGLPISLSGAEGESARLARSYALELAAALLVPVYLVDERLTSVAAGAALQAGGHTTRSARRVVDQAAAAALLQGVLDARVAGGHECGTVLSGGLGERVIPTEGGEQ
jgi:putative Holliday junction resolvase